MSTCMFRSKARYSAQVSPSLGVSSLSTAGSSARFRNTTALSRAPVLSKSAMKCWASSLVIPMAQKMTAKDSASPRALACLAICRATSLWGRPAAEKMGSFCPLTRVLVPSMVEIPVWMKALGFSRDAGLMAAPMISLSTSGTMAGPPSLGLPDPDRTRPMMLGARGILMTSPVNLTALSLDSPPVPSKTWTTTISSEVSRTCPLFNSPPVLISTSSPKPTGSVFSTKIRGPLISLIVLYSLVIAVAILDPPYFIALNSESI